MITKTLANTSNGDTQQDQHTNPWDTNKNLIPQPHLDGLKRFISWWPNPYHIPTSFGNNGYNYTNKTRLHSQSRRSKPTTQGEQPRCYKPTSTSGPLINRRVIIHIKDHTPQANRQATNIQTIPHTPRDTMTFTPHKQSKLPKVLQPINSSLLTSFNQTRCPLGE